MFCSVAMSTYNGERFLAEQLSSICAQTRPVDEIVVSDDGSSDGTLRILDDFRLAHPQIRWKILPSAENHGFRESFLRALKACGGDLIFLCDQDDRWAPGKVETMLRHFEANPAMLSLISDFKTIDADGNLLNPNAPTKKASYTPRPGSATQAAPSSASTWERTCITGATKRFSYMMSPPHRRKMLRGRTAGCRQSMTVHRGEDTPLCRALRLAKCRASSS